MASTSDIPLFTTIMPTTEIVTSITGSFCFTVSVDSPDSTSSTVFMSSLNIALVITPPIDARQEQNDDGGSSAGGIVAGCVVAFIVFVAVVVCLIIFLIWYRTKKKRDGATRSGLCIMLVALVYS